MCKMTGSNLSIFNKMILTTIHGRSWKIFASENSNEIRSARNENLFINMLILTIFLLYSKEHVEISQ